MLHLPGNPFPSDEITFREGYDGTEPREVASWVKRNARFGRRFTWSLNTYYPEVHGGYFENRFLFGLIGAGLSNARLFPVPDDCYSAKATVIPVVGYDQLCVGEGYALVDSEEEQKGVAYIWQSCAAGNTTYYADNVVFDFILPEPFMSNAIEGVKAQCARHRVSYKEAETPMGMPSPAD